MSGLDRLKTGDWSRCHQENLDDGSVRVVLVKRGEGKVYRFRVRDLYGPAEEVLEETIEGGDTNEVDADPGDGDHRGA